MELIQAAFAALFGAPGVSAPGAVPVAQLAWLKGLLSTRLAINAVLVDIPPAK